MNQKNLRIIRTVLYGVMILLLVLISFKLGALYGEFKDGQSLMEFATSDKLYEWNRYESPPQELIDQTTAYNKVVIYVWYIIGVNFMIMIVDYYLNPETHYFTKIIEKLKEIDEKCRRLK